MRVLVLGGGVFAGRTFCVKNHKDFELVTVTTGKHPLKLEGVRELVCDRKSARAVAKLAPKDEMYDAIVDFCAKEPSDVKSIAAAFRGRVRQYVLISCSAVLGNSDFNMEGNAETQIEIEKTAIRACQENEIAYTILRPQLLYGGQNPEMRERWIIEQIAVGIAPPYPADSTSVFNLCYVEDLAGAVSVVIGNEKAYNSEYVVASPEHINYNRLFSDFERFNGGVFPIKEMKIDEITAKRVNIPFPLTGNSYVDGTALTRDFDFKYTPFSEGMERTYFAIIGKFRG